MIKFILQSAIRPFSRSVVFPDQKLAVSPSIKLIDTRNIHLTSNVRKEVKVGREKVRIQALKTMGEATGEYGNDSSLMSSDKSLFPDATTAETLFNNIPYNKLHIFNIKATMNNTIMTVTDYRGKVIFLNSPGIEGFKNTKKSTNVAAQQAATTLGKRAINAGIELVRLRIQGLGPGRMGSLKGVETSGLRVISITDNTRVSWYPPRPRKPKRL